MLGNEVQMHLSSLHFNSYMVAMIQKNMFVIFKYVTLFSKPYYIIMLFYKYNSVTVKDGPSFSTILSSSHTHIHTNKTPFTHLFK